MPYSWKRALPQVLAATGLILIMDVVTQTFLHRHFLEPWVAAIIIFLIATTGWKKPKQ